ncbi:MAG: hypothetical protein ACW99R_15480 [Candidatus Hodarchaeales archaeon]
MNNKNDKISITFFLFFFLLFFLIPGETSLLYPKFEIKGNETTAPVWEKVFESPNEDAPTQMLATPDGYLLTGSHDRGGPIQLPWLIKVDMEGNHQWNQSYTPSIKPQGHVRSITQAPDGGYALTGLAFSTDSSTWDLWILKTDENGRRVEQDSKRNRRWC